MRDDMYKLIVERPRRRLGDPPRLSRDGRHFRNYVWPDDEGGNAPHRLGMKAGYRNQKWLNENLAPLKRWLAAQVNRPWNKVYSEICANIDRRNTVQEHIFTHIEQFVAVKTRLVDGQVVTLDNYRQEPSPIGEVRAGLFVHPHTGILLANRARLRVKQERDAARDHGRNEKQSQRKVLSETEVLLLLYEGWFSVTLAPLPPGVPSGKADAYGRVLLRHQRCWDVVKKQMVSRLDQQEWLASDSCYGKLGWYAVAKRQLSAKEIKRRRLKQQAGTSRPFFCHWYGILPRRCTICIGARSTKPVRMLRTRLLAGVLPKLVTAFDRRHTAAARTLRSTH